MGLLGIGIVNFMMPSKNAAAATTAPPSQPQQQQSQNATPAPNTAATLSKRVVELTGFRVRQDKSGKTSVQYVVINHGETDMKGLTAYVVLRSASAKPQQAPIANFTVRLPPVGAMESKDLTTLVDTPVQHGVPDWTDLKAEVRIEQ
jgi:hypothetical protein